MRRFSSCIAAAFIAALVVAPASAGEIAPEYVSSEPSDGEELHRAPDRVEVTFSEPLDESSELAVEDGCGRTVDDGQVAVDGNTISVGISKKPSGHYQVSYSASGLAGITGTTNGGFHFMVHFGEKCSGDGGGGHANHGGKKKNDKNDGHDGHGGNTGGGSHDGSGSGDHSTSDHSTTTGTTHGDDHMTTSDHSMSGPGDRNEHNKHGNRHGKNKRHGKHRDHVKQPQEPDDGATDDPTFAAGDGAPIEPDGRAVLFALVFSLALGSVGGWFLRVSAAR